MTECFVRTLSDVSAIDILLFQRSPDSTSDVAETKGQPVFNNTSEHMPPPMLTENTDENFDETRRAAIKRTEEGWEPEKTH